MGAPFSAVTTGFIAQEVLEAADAASFEFSGVDSPQNDHDYYSLRYAEFVVPLVKAVQEQQEIIEDQQSQITNLQEKYDEIMLKVSKIANE
jgi:hypothetical protein